MQVSNSTQHQTKENRTFFPGFSSPASFVQYSRMLINVVPLKSLTVTRRLPLWLI